MISVIITTHNGRKDKCKRAIESVLKQSYKDFELIVVDDASTDGTDEMVIAFHDKRITYLRRAENFGNDTRPKNEGILESKGEYISFLDSDNEYRTDHLQVLFNAIKDSEKIDVVYGDRMLIWDDNSNRPQIGIYSDYSPSLLFKRNYIDTSDALIKREALYKVGGFDERFNKYVDWNLWLRMSKAGLNFKHIPLIITDYHIHDQMKSATKKTENEKKFEEWFGQANFLPDWKPITRKDPTDFGAYDLEIELPYLGEKKEPRVAIFSLTYDRLDYTKKCFESLYKTAGYDFDHFVVDNGSQDGTVEYLKKAYPKKVIKDGTVDKWHDNMVIIENKENVGISKASNQAIEAITKGGSADWESTPTPEMGKNHVSMSVHKNPYDIIVKVDNDALFETEGWLAKMVEIWKSNHRIALSCYVQGLRDNPGGAPRIGQGMIKDELIGMTKHLGGICHFVDASAYKDFRWDEHDFLHGLQDIEFSRYLLNQGYQMGYLENYFLSHIDGTEGQHEKYPEYFERRKKEKSTRA